MKARLTERALIRIDRAVFAAVSDRDPADEVGGGIAVDDLSQQRPLPAVQLPCHPIDELLDDWDMHRGRCARALSASQQAIVPVQLDRSVSRLHAQRDEGPLGPVARVIEAEHFVRVLEQLLQPGLERMLLLAMLVVGSEHREYVASGSPVGGLDARYRVWPDAGRDCYRPWLDVDLLPITLPLSVGARDIQKLFRVRPRPLSELAGESRQPALVLHVKKELGRTICVGGHDHLLCGICMTLDMRRSLRPAGVPYVYLETTSLKRGEFVHLVQLVDHRAELLGQVEVVRRQLVLGVVAAADTAVAARDAAAAPWSDPAEVRIVGLDARATEVDAHWGLVERFPSPHLARYPLQGPIHVGWHVRIANDAEHSCCLIDAWRHFVGPVGNARPSWRVEELFRRDVQGVAIDMRAAAHACAREDEHIVQILHPLDPIHLCRGHP